MAGRFFGAGNAPAAATAAESEDAAAIQTPPPSQVEKRLALVIGNTRYRAEPLSNAAADAALIGRILPALGFETMRIEDAGAEALRSGVIGFANTLALAGPGAVAFVYYAGHGIQVSDTSYLLPVDVTSAELAAAAPKLMPLWQVIALISAARPKAAALIIDACRTAPLGFQPLSASPTGGQAVAERPPDGMLIAYSTAAGASAEDGESQNGPYAAALAQELPRLLEPGVRIHDIFVTTGERVREQTGGAQSPALYLQGSLPVLTVTEEDITRYRTWDFRQRAGVGARLLQALGAAAIGLAALAIGTSWFGAEPEVRARWLYDLGLGRPGLFDLDCSATAPDRFGLMPSDWCRTAARDLVAPVRATGQWAERVVAPAAAGDPAALLLAAEDRASGPPTDGPEALGMALRAARVGWLPAWETVARLQQAFPDAATAADPAELRAGLAAAGDAGIGPADVLVAWNNWLDGHPVEAEARFLRADRSDPSGAAARWHAEALLQGSPLAGLAPDGPAAAERLLAACTKGDALAALTLVDLDSRFLQGLESRDVAACTARAAAGRGPDAAHLRAVLNLRGESPADPAQIRADLEHAAGAGNIAAMMLLSGLLASGSYGMERDLPAAVALAERAALTGHPLAITLLASLLLEGEGTTEDYARARALLEKAVAAAEVEAALFLGNLHAAGAFADSTWDKAREMGSFAQQSATATVEQRFAGDRLVQRADRGALLARMAPPPVRIGADDAPMRLTVIFPLPCKGCDRVMLGILPQLVASHVEAGLLAVDLRVARASDAAVDQAPGACTADAEKAALRWRQALDESPTWKAVPPALVDAVRLALGPAALEAACTDDAGVLSGLVRFEQPVLIANGALIDKTSIDTARRALVEAAPPPLWARLATADLATSVPKSDDTASP